MRVFKAHIDEPDVGGIGGPEERLKRNPRGILAVGRAEETCADDRKDRERLGRLRGRREIRQFEIVDDALERGHAALNRLPVRDREELLRDRFVPVRFEFVERVG